GVAVPGDGDLGMLDYVKGRLLPYSAVVIAGEDIDAEVNGLPLRDYACERVEFDGVVRVRRRAAVEVLRPDARDAGDCERVGPGFIHQLIAERRPVGVVLPRLAGELRDAGVHRLQHEAIRVAAEGGSVRAEVHLAVLVEGVDGGVAFDLHSVESC